MPSIDISHLDYPQLVALRDDVNRRILQIRRTPSMRLDELLLLFEETRQALTDHGYTWHSLERWQWMDGEIRFWLNPIDAQRYAVGWFSIDELIAWLNHQGPIMLSETEDDDAVHDDTVFWAQHK